MAKHTRHLMSNQPPLPHQGDCILFATADWDEPYWTNKQHTARALVTLGWRVLYVESVGMRSPRANSKRDWKRLLIRLRKGLWNLIAGAKERESNLWVLSPLAIPAAHQHPLLGKLNRFLLQAGIKRHIAQRKFNSPLIWTYHPFIFQAIDGIKRGPLLYHCVDDLSAVPGVDPLNFREAENHLLTQCDHVYATTQHLADRCSSINPATDFLPNVVDLTHFSKALNVNEIPDDLANIPQPRLIYHGVLSDFKIDFDLIYEAALLKPEWHWIFIGEEREGQRNPTLLNLAKLSNVHFLGYRPYQILPNYLRGMDVGLLPSLLNDYTKSMFPMKYFEYLSAGLPVVATALDFTNHYHEGIEIGNNSSEFIQAIHKQLSRGKFSSESSKKMIGDNTWINRTKKMIAPYIK
jgi:glycosyltransferase involved in cell wall biosynthesis